MNIVSITLRDCLGLSSQGIYIYLVVIIIIIIGDEVNITTEGQRHLGAVIGSQEFKDYRKKVLGWKGELEAHSI